MTVPGKASRVVGRVVSRLRSDELRARVEQLEAEVAECRQLNLRLAELTDVVQELLVPLSSSDRAKVDEVLERYTRELGS